jgi:hypothetical protein
MFLRAEGIEFPDVGMEILLLDPILMVPPHTSETYISFTDSFCCNLIIDRYTDIVIISFCMPFVNVCAGLVRTEYIV